MEQRFAWLGSCAHRICTFCHSPRSACPVCHLPSTFKPSQFHNASHVVEIMASVICEITKTLNTLQHLPQISNSTLPPPVTDLFAFPVETPQSSHFHSHYPTYTPNQPHLESHSTNNGSSSFHAEQHFSFAPKPSPSHQANHAYSGNDREMGYEASRSEKLANLERYNAPIEPSPKKRSGISGASKAKKTTATSSRAKRTSIGLEPSSKRTSENSTSSTHAPPRVSTSLSPKMPANMTLHREPSIAQVNSFDRPHIVSPTPIKSSGLPNQAAKDYLERLKSQFDFE